jgi:hypothetical protein
LSRVCAWLIQPAAVTPSERGIWAAGSLKGVSSDARATTS